MNRMDQEAWNERFNDSLRIHYALTIDEAGIPPYLLMAYRALHPYDPDHAVWAYGHALDLEPMQSVLEVASDPA